MVSKTPVDIEEGSSDDTELEPWRAAARRAAAEFRMAPMPREEHRAAADGSTFYLQNDDQDECLILPRQRLAPLVQSLVERQQNFFFCRDQDGIWLTVPSQAFAAMALEGFVGASRRH